MVSSLFQNYTKVPIELVRGLGTTVFDQEGKSYLDFTSGIAVCNLGHCHPQLVSVLEEQSHKIWHTSNLFENSLQEEVAEALCGVNYVAFFANSGAEANEAALKLARRHTGKEKIITCKNSFHGRTFATMSATGQAKIHEGFGSLLPTFDYVAYNDFSALEAAIDEETAAVMLELVQGEGGVIPAEKEYITDLVALCHKMGVLVIVDEVQTGIGRTGNFFCYQHYDFEPDIITLAKGLGSGFPVGAMLGKKELAKSFGAGVHGSTFGGNKLAMAVASKTIEIINEEPFLADVTNKSLFFKQILNEQLAAKKQVVAIRGMGLMIGIELTIPVVEIVEKLRTNGLLVLGAGEKVLRILPPLIVTKTELEQASQMIQEVIV